MPDGTPRKPRHEADADRKARQVEEMEQIRLGLRNNAAILADKLMGKPGRRSGQDLRYPGSNGGIKITIRGSAAGCWFDFGAKQGGDMLTLMQRERGLTFPQAVEEARTYLGMPQPDYSRPMSDAERHQVAQRTKALAEERAQAEAESRARADARREQVAKRAQYLWDAYAASPATKDHPYVARKGVDPDGLRVNRRGQLLVPMRDRAGKVWTLQRIGADGDKRMLFGGKAKACFHLLGEHDREKPILFCEGEATGRSLHACSGLPVVVTFSANNMRDVVRAWRAENPDQLLIVAGDNDHHKPRMDPPKANVGADMAGRLQGEAKAVPALPPFEPADAGKDWNDFHQAKGAAAVWEFFDRLIESVPRARKETSPMPDGAVATPPGVSPESADQRRILTEAAAVEAIRLGTTADPRQAAMIGKAMVDAMSDPQVASTLASLPDRKWAMRPDGTLDPDAKVAAKPAPADPMVALVERLKQQADALRQQHPDLAKAIDALAAKGADAFTHTGLRTRVSWVVMDVERATGAKIEMPADLRREIDGRMVTYPGLTNPRAQALMRETASMASVALVREIRRMAADVVKGGSQDAPEVSDRLDVLENKVRIRGPAPSATTSPGGPPPYEPPGEVPPHHAAPPAAPASPPAATEPPVVPVSQVASPGPGPQPAPAPTYAGQPKQQGQEPAAAPIEARRSLSETLRHKMGGLASAPSSGIAPWTRLTAGLAERIDNFEAGVADRRMHRLVAAAEASGKAALSAVETFVAGPGKGILGRVEAAAAQHPGGMAAVIGGMHPGGSHANLRTDFNRALSERGFGEAYAGAKAAIEAYGAARGKVGHEVNARGLGADKLAPLEKLEAALGEEASRIPGTIPGKNMLDELASKVAQVLSQAMEKAREKVRSLVSGVTAAATTSPSPSPSP